MDKGNVSPMILTSREVAHILHLHINTVRRWERQGILRVYRIGPRHDRRFEQDEILRLIDTTGNGNNRRE